MTLAGITRHPTEEWMKQVARNAVDVDTGYLRQVRYLLHDRDTKFCASFKDILKTEGVTCVTLPPRSPNLNAFAERWVRSVKQECLSRLILFGEASGVTMVATSVRIFRPSPLTKMPMRIHLLTGRTEILRSDGWTVTKGSGWALPTLLTSEKSLSPLPIDEAAKVTGNATVYGDSFFGKVYNGSSWVVREVRVNITVKEKDGSPRWDRDFNATGIWIPPLEIRDVYIPITGASDNPPYEWRVVSAKGHQP